MRLKTGLGALLLTLCLAGLASGCAHVQPEAQDFHPGEYTPVTIEQLQAPRISGLAAGQKVSVDGYFWQYLDYNPFMAPEYLAMVRRPVAGSRRRWAALYDTPQMQGYYDRLALTPEQQRDWILKRLDHVRVYGRLAHLPFGILYLQARHIQQLDEEKGSLTQKPATPAVQGQENQSP